MEDSGFLKEILTNKRSIPLHLFIGFIGVLNILFSNIYNIGIFNQVFFILSFLSITILLLHLSGLYSKYISIVLYAFYVIFFIEISLSILYSGVTNKYNPLYNSKDINQYNSRKPEEKYFLSKSEFSFPRRGNSLGFPDEEWSLKKNTGTIRIICLGDSFTEGDGAAIETSYVSVLKRNLQKKFPDIEVFNAGTSGSDPFFNFRSLTHNLYKYEPDIVIQSFTINDYFQDIATRGGEERFQNDNTLRYRKGYWWERVYAHSVILQVLLTTIGGYDPFLIKRSEYARLYPEITKACINLFQKYHSFTNDKNSDLIVFSIPLKPDFGNKKQNNEFHQKFQKEFSAFNLNFYNLQFCYEEEFRKNNSSFKDYYWQQDGHHNAKGYEMMAKCIEKIVTPVIEKRIANKNTLVN